jgi:hypothetical protein
MPYPILEFDPTHEAIIEPSMLWQPLDMPEHCIICFFKEVVDNVVAENEARMGLIPSMKSSIMASVSLFIIQASGHHYLLVY